jgi:hypothetical protein
MNKYYCKGCDKFTHHQPSRGFFGDLLISVATGFKANLNDKKYTCVQCGKVTK